MEFWDGMGLYFEQISIDDLDFDIHYMRFHLYISLHLLRWNNVKSINAKQEMHFLKNTVNDNDFYNSELFTLSTR